MKWWLWQWAYTVEGWAKAPINDICHKCGRTARSWPKRTAEEVGTKQAAGGLTDELEAEGVAELGGAEEAATKEAKEMPKAPRAPPQLGSGPAPAKDPLDDLLG